MTMLSVCVVCRAPVSEEGEGELAENADSLGPAQNY